jgi:hypothetical protein
MAHYAFLDDNNYVIQVIEGNSDLIDGLEACQWYQNFMGMKCVQTYPYAEFRFNYAGIGFIYDSVADAFIPPKNNCHAEEILDETTYRWTCFNANHME